MYQSLLLNADAANAQTAALIKLKPAGIKLICSKFDGGKDRHQYSQWYSQYTAMIEASGVEDNRVKSVNNLFSLRWSCFKVSIRFRDK